MIYPVHLGSNLGEEAVLGNEQKELLVVLNEQRAYCMDGRIERLYRSAEHISIFSLMPIA